MNEKEELKSSISENPSNPFFFYILTSSLLIKPVFTFIFFLLLGIYLDKRFAAQFFTTACITLGLFLIVYDIYRTVKELIRELDKYATLPLKSGKNLPGNATTREKYKYLLKDYFQKKYAQALTKMHVYPQKKDCPQKSSDLTFKKVQYHAQKNCQKELKEKIKLVTSSLLSNIPEAPPPKKLHHYKDIGTLLYQIRLSQQKNQGEDE